jgi:hypothetical protein
MMKILKEKLSKVKKNLSGGERRVKESEKRAIFGQK